MSSTAADGEVAGGEAALAQQQQRLRVAEWSALQQELQIVSMHSRKLQYMSVE